MPLLRLESLTTEYETRLGSVRAVEDVTFTIEKSETFGLVGESGCGKSSIGLSILRLLPANARVTRGRILYDGVDLLEQDEEYLTRKIRGKKISMIFQDPTASMDPVFSIQDQLMESIQKNRKISKDEAEKEAVRMFDFVRLPPELSRSTTYPHELSGGMRQRVMIAIALSCGPGLLIADEPTTNLDVTIEAQILDLVNELKEKLGMSVLLIAHNMGVIAQMCDKVGVMYAGNLVEVGPVRDVLKNPKHPYTQALLAAVPKISGPIEERKPIPGSVPDLRSPPPGCRFHPRCPFVMDVCRRVAPRLEDITPNHFASCYLYQRVGNSAANTA